MSLGFQETFRPRRFLTSVAIGLALWFALGPLTGIAMARDDGGVTWPETWKAPERLPGDGGEYRWSEPGADAAQEFDFEWVGPKATLLQTGKLGEVLEVRLRSAGAPADPFVYDHEIFRVDHAGNVLSTGPEKRDETFGACPDVGVACTNHSKAIERSYFHATDLVQKIPCGLVHAAQSREVRLREAFLFSAACDGEASPRRAQVVDVSQDPQGRLHVQVSVQRTSSAPTMSILLRDDVPYPIQIDPDAGRTGPVLTLSSFRRGTPADALPLNPSVPDPGPFEPVRRGRWGPSEEGLLVTYPLSVAIRDAAAVEPRLALYLLQYPDAYAARSDMRMIFFDPVVERNHTWHVTLTDGIHNFDFSVTRVTRPTGDETRVEVHSPSAERFPDAADLPTQMPTAKQLLRRWAAYYGSWGSSALGFTGLDSEFSTYDPPGGWGMIANCADAACKDFEIQYHVCQSYDITRIMVFPDTEQLRNDKLSMTCSTLFDKDGNPIESHETYSQNAVIRGSPPDRVQAPQGNMAAITVADDPSVATRVFIGAGLASVFAAAFYWLWPAIRSAFGLTLFTRIQKPTVLDNRIRADVLALIEAEPGIHVRELRRRLKRAHGTIIHHLRMLVRNNLVAARAANGRTCYFPVAIDDAQRDRVLVTSDHRMAFLRLVAERPNTSLSELARALGLRRQTIHESTKRMQRDGLIEILLAGRSRNVTVTELGRKALSASDRSDGHA